MHALHRWRCVSTAPHLCGGDHGDTLTQKMSQLARTQGRPCSVDHASRTPAALMHTSLPEHTWQHPRAGHPHLHRRPPPTELRAQTRCTHSGNSREAETSVHTRRWQIHPCGLSLSTPNRPSTQPPEAPPAGGAPAGALVLHPRFGPHAPHAYMTWGAPAGGRP